MVVPRLGFGAAARPRLLDLLERHVDRSPPGQFHAIRMPFPSVAERLQRVEGWTTRVGLINDEIGCGAGKVLARGQFLQGSADRCESC